MGLFTTKIQVRLLVTLLVSSTLPLAIGGSLFYSLVNQTITSETFAKIAGARDAKSSEIAQYLTFAQRQAESLAQSANARYSVGDFYGFSYALRQLSADPQEAGARLRAMFGVEPGRTLDAGIAPEVGDVLLREALEYANIHRRFHPAFQDFLETSEFDNLYLIDRRGQVVYSAVKDGYLGLVLPEQDSPVARAYRDLTDGAVDQAVFQDFSLDPVSGRTVAYLVVGVELYQNADGALVLSLPASGLQSLLEQGDSLTLISSRDAVVASSAGTGLALNQQVDVPEQMRQGDAVDTLDVGLIGEPSLSAWTRFTAPQPDWLLVAESRRDTAFATGRQLRNALIGIGMLAAVILTAVAYTLSRAITKPIRDLAGAAGAIAEGALDHSLPEYDRPREYASLSRAVSQMRRSLRAQLDLIQQKNDELNRHLRQIEDKNAKLQEADRMKDQFLANTSHELRTPLNGIIGISETLEAGAMGDLTSAQKSQLRLVSFSARRLSRLVDDLLDIYRIREGRMRLDIQSVDVFHSVRNVARLAQPLLKENATALHLEVEADTPPVLADPVRFEQTLFNLVSNAVRHAGTDQVLVAATAAGTGDAPKVSVSVRDRGSGIAPESLERIFHPLEQITGAINAGRQDGTGLGLTIARNLADLMSGTIEVSSALGEGSEFVLTLPRAPTPAIAPRPSERLPLATADLSELQPVPETAAAVSPKGLAPSILLVDDEPINLQVLRNVLLPQGYRVRDCANGADAIRAVAEETPDLIVLDVMMTGMSGLEVARHLRRQHSLLDLPIILLTARGRTSDLLAGFEAGANDYVVKPFVKDELLTRIRTLLEAGRARRRAAENTELKAEIQRRIQVEDALRLSQRRMAQMLASIDDGLICVNAGDMVTFSNRAADELLGRSIVVDETTLAEAFPAPVLETLRSASLDSDGDSVSAQINGRTLGINVFDMEPEAGGGRAYLLSTAESRRESFVLSVRDAIDTTLPSIVGPGPETGTTAGAPDGYRRQIVAAMTGTLDLWWALTGKGKIEFAEESRIWRVNLDKTSLQTRTLDKYLMLETLPDNPRWRDVIRSVDFILSRAEPVLTGADADAPDSAEIAEIAGRLRAARQDLRRDLTAR